MKAVKSRLMAHNICTTVAEIMCTVMQQGCVPLTYVHTYK